MNMSNISNYIGMVGVIMVLYAYLLLQLGKWQQRRLRFSLINLTGSIFILVSLYYHFNLASFVIEIVWLLISAYGAIKTMIKRRQQI